MESLDDWYNIEMEEMVKYHEDQWNKRKEEIKDLIHPKYFDFLETLDTYYDDGIVCVKEVDEKQSGYSNTQRNCRIIGEENLGLFMYSTDEVEYYYNEGLYEGEEVEYWVNQWTVGLEEDSYQGIMLLELSDNTYWKVSYSC